jgi:hypothetical protein
MQALTIQPMFMNGNLDKAKALSALSTASNAATAALPSALIKCDKPEQMQKIMADRDLCQLAYTNSLVLSLKHTGPLFSKIADDLEATSEEVLKQATQLQNAVEAVKLLTDLVKLATSLALAFA